MNEDSKSKISQLRIDPAAKRRSTGMVKFIFIGVVIAAVVALFLWRPWMEEGQRVTVGGGKTVAVAVNPINTPGTTNSPAANPTPNDDGVVLTVSGYIVNRERIEISPRFMGMVTWIGVKKGDAVTNGQVVVLLDDTELLARLREADGQVANARAALAKAQRDFERMAQLARTDIESKQALDDARNRVESTKAQLAAIEGARDVAATYLGWCTIRSPLDGVVLEKLVDPNELVTPQSFGGTRGPSTALIAVADPKDLQVEIDMNEADLAKVSLNQKCRVSPEAYLEKSYEGVVAEIAPEANRAKGTLQIKVQIRNPDRFLTPELSAKVDFLKSN
jgi:HlyD family secretion protein